MQDAERQETGLGIATVARTQEVASSAMAAKAKAIVESRYVIAYNRPRNIDQVRINILAACKRPGFAEVARYNKPVGGGTVGGFSIRFAEEAIKAMTNVAVDSVTVFEDNEKRTIQISVTDLESNVTYGKDITVNKTVERRTLKPGQAAISRRVGSTGHTVFLVEATEDEISNKIAAAESKIIRNCGLRLVPSDILEEAETHIEQTLTKGGTDVKADIKKLADAFASLNISPIDLERFLGHAIATVSPKELATLRAVYATIKDGEAAWADYANLSDPKEPKSTKPSLEPKPTPEPPKPSPATPSQGTPLAAEENFDKDEAPTTELYDAHTALSEFIADAGVEVGDFLSWLNTNGIDRKYKVDATALSSIAELPAQLCIDVAKDTKGMAKLVRTYGLKPS